MARDGEEWIVQPVGGPELSMGPQGNEISWRQRAVRWLLQHPTSRFSSAALLSTLLRLCGPTSNTGPSLRRFISIGLMFPACKTMSLRAQKHWRHAHPAPHAADKGASTLESCDATAQMREHSWTNPTSSWARCSKSVCLNTKKRSKNM
jgi:hypothetical protein